jgi:hypothetical protein
MTFTNTNYYIAVDKGLKVIQSCDNMEQLKHAETYVDLVKNRFSDLFIEDNKTIIKQYRLLRSYIKYQHVIIKNK